MLVEALVAGVGGMMDVDDLYRLLDWDELHEVLNIKEQESTDAEEQREEDTFITGSTCSGNPI